MEKKMASGMKSVLKAQAKKLQARWRKVVTGNSNKRIRDHIREAQEKPKYVKLIDKIAFTLGVLNIVACQYFLLNVPEYFPTWFALILPTMMVSRFYHFKSLNWQYFLIDFCYLTNFLSLLNILVVRSQLLFKVVFVFATGVLPIAIPVWRNSLIFHDFDKIVSVYIHILPCMLYYTMRWHGGPCTNQCSPLRLTDYFWAILLYGAWQVAYLVQTEVIDRKKFDSHPELATSLRWLAKDTKNSLARAALRTLKLIGVFKMDEDFDSTSMKTKLVFVGSQFLLVLVSFLPTPIIYYSGEAHLLWIAIIFTISVFNGASWYIEVFSIRYQKRLTKLEEMQSIAQDASHIVQQLAAGLEDTPPVHSPDTAAAAAAAKIEKNHHHHQQQQQQRRQPTEGNENDDKDESDEKENDENGGSEVNLLTSSQDFALEHEGLTIEVECHHSDDEDDGELLDLIDAAGYEADLLEIDS